LYATFGRRFRALVLDSVVYALSLGLFVVLLEVVGSQRALTAAIFALWLGFAFLYEPVLVWRRGATLGHAWANIRVVDLRSGGNPTFIQAGIRFLLKAVAGLLAFVFMGTTRRHQALHDIVCGTTVEIRDPERADGVDYVEERKPDSLTTSAPAWRRIVVVLLYSMLILIPFAILLGVIQSEACLTENRCSASERLAGSVCGFAWLGAQALVIIYGWRGRLLGARGRRKAP
jgi:uncharacterized RDD family membrane protein YckC